LILAAARLSMAALEKCAEDTLAAGRRAAGSGTEEAKEK
jgi:hypothetical protein